MMIHIDDEDVQYDSDIYDGKGCESITLDQASMQQLLDLTVAAWILCPPTSKDELIKIYTQLDELQRDVDRAIYRSKPEPLPQSD